MKHTITYFMWAYQPHFCLMLRLHAEKVLGMFAPDLAPETFLVGVHLTAEEAFDVCVEPEDGNLPVSLFDGLPRRIEELYEAHPNQQVFYGDAPSMQRKPQLMRADATRTAVQERLDAFDREHGTISFCGLPGHVKHAEVGEYAVVPVLQFHRATFDRYRHLTKERVGEGYHSFRIVRSLVDAVIDILLSDAKREFLHDEPGSMFSAEFHRDATDILREAARQLMNRVGWVNSDVSGIYGLFETCTTIASLRHEHAESVGGLIIARSGHPSVLPVVTFQKSVPLRTPNWARKILDLTAEGVYLLCDSVGVHGLGTLGPYSGDTEDLFVVEFTGFHKWDLVHGGQILMRTEFGVPGLPAERFSRDRFIENLLQIFGEMTIEEAGVIWDVVNIAAEQKKGTMVVVARNAEQEAVRLVTQATPIVPQPLTEALVQQLTGIDGALLLDTHGRCHAIGVIFDGQATDAGKPARGARFNSAVRYVESAKGNALAVVISEDGNFDVLTLLRRRVRRADVASAVADLHALAMGNEFDKLPEVRERVQAHRFYFNDEQCKSLNDDLEILRVKVLATNRLWPLVSCFAPNDAMNDDYFIKE
jgi:hypothetical protein